MGTLNQNILIYAHYLLLREIKEVNKGLLMFGSIEQRSEK